MTDTEPALPPPIVPCVARALSPLLRRIAADVDGEAGVNTYLVGIDEIAVIDPGPTADHLDAICGCGGDRIQWILVTGAVDQSGVAELRRRTGARVVAVEGVGPDDADEVLAPGTSLLGTEFRLTAVVAPGLGGPRTAFVLEEERTLIAGDWLDPDTEVVDAPARAAAVGALRRKRLRAVAPAHGQLVEHAADVVRAIAGG